MAYTPTTYILSLGYQERLKSCIQYYCFDSQDGFLSCMCASVGFPSKISYLYMYIDLVP